MVYYKLSKVRLRMGLQDAKIVKIGRKASAGRVKPIKSKPGLWVWWYCTAGLLIILTYV